MDKQQLLRIYTNISALLQEGQFPGKYYQAIAEAQQLISGVMSEIESSIRSEEDAGRVGSDGVSDRKRKTSKRKTTKRAGSKSNRA